MGRGWIRYLKVTVMANCSEKVLDWFRCCVVSWFLANGVVTIGNEVVVWKTGSEIDLYF